jgi:hypothetical protein
MTIPDLSILYRINIHPVSAGRWQITDPDQRSDGAGNVLGVITQRGEVYEATHVRRPREFQYFATLPAAMMYFVTSLPQAGTTTPLAS